MFEHSVLMDAGFVREGVFTDDGFIARNGHAGDLRHQATGGKEARRMNPRMYSEDILAGLDRHDGFLEGAIAGTLADAVDGALDLPCPGAYRRQAVGDRHAQVVVAVNGEHRSVDVVDVAYEVREDFVKLFRHRVADGIGDINRRGARVDGGFNDLREKLEFRARGVFRRELHIGAKTACERHAFDRLLDDLLLRHVEFVFAMNGAGGEEDVDAWTGGILQRAPCGLDVFAIAPREAGDDRAVSFASDQIHRLPIAGRGDWETGFDDVDPEFRERLRYPQLLRLGHAAARRLLTVAQRGIEDEDAARRCRGRRRE